MAKKQSSTDTRDSIDENDNTVNSDKSGMEVAGVEAIAETLAESMPGVNEHAIAHEAMVEQEKAEQWAELRDKNGDTFNPSIHRTTKDGEPLLSSKGNLVLRSGRKKGGESKPKSIVGGVSAYTQNSEPEITPQMQARATGKAAANILITLGVQFGGEEFYPIKRDEIGVDEKASLEKAFADYFEATGRTDFPPGVALSIAVAGYIAPRLTMPKTRTRMERFKLWVATKWSNRKIRKQSMEAKQHLKVAE
jgi:hypothetical protein